MKLIVQPEAGLVPIVTAIKQAKKTVDVLIFRLDRREIVREFEAAIARGVRVRTLTAHQNRGGTKSLRKLEMQLLEAGVTVSRTADDLVRYHAKMIIIDGRVLHVYGFNFTRLDIAKSRSFGIITKNPKLVREAIKLFEADFERQAYVPGYNRFVVSPENSRERLRSFIKGTRRELLIYDPQVTDDAMLRLLSEKERAGVVVKIIGKVEPKWELDGHKIPGTRLHARAIIRDGRRAFIGSQSLRRLELDKRREVGIIITDESVVRELRNVFKADWALTEAGRKEEKKAEKAEKKEKENGKKENGKKEKAA
jgi:phosphatidylserine/phosphatidylglycerophosphate/cardiolipin synthase-like enzyme